MTDIYRPRDGRRIPMPFGEPDWPQDGRPVDFSKPYERRLVLDGDLELVESKAAASPAPPARGRAKAAPAEAGQAAIPTEPAATEPEGGDA